MKTLIILAFVTIFQAGPLAQNKVETDIDVAFQNAKKGIYWALSNIPEKKTKIENDLIADDKLYANIKLSKEINGIRIESVGYFNSNEVVIKIYKSNDSLEKDGYLKKELDTEKETKKEENDN